MNSSVNVATGKTPYECMYGYLPDFGDSVLLRLADTDNYTPPEDVRSSAISSIRISQQKAKARYDAKRFRGAILNVGDIVTMIAPVTSTGTSTKLQARYKGPLVVTEVLPSDTYRVGYLGDIDGSRYSTTAHISQLKIFYSHVEDEEEPADEALSDDNINIEGSESLTQVCDEVVATENLQEEVPPSAQSQRRSRRPPPRLDNYVWGHTPCRMAGCKRSVISNVRRRPPEEEGDCDTDRE